MAQFLTEDWITQAKAIREEYEGNVSAPPVAVKANLNVKDCPDGVGAGGVLEAHIDTSDGVVVMEVGHLDDAHVTMTIPYAIAQQALVEQNPQAIMQAFLSGQMQVTGDMAKLMGLQAGADDPLHQEIAAKIQAITD